MHTSTYGGHGRRALDPAASLTGRRRICAGLMKRWVSVLTGIAGSPNWEGIYTTGLSILSLSPQHSYLGSSAGPHDF
eukprot:scaffold262_cov103-Isochrysis_galbana.AAC.2